MSSENKNNRLLLTKKAFNYFEENYIPKLIENSLNDIIKVCPDDACGYLSKYFENLSHKPQLTRIELHESTGDFGNSTISMKLFSTFKNEEIESANIKIPNIFDVKPGEIFSADNMQLNQKIIKRCIELMNIDLSKLFIGIDPTNHELVRQILKTDIIERQKEYEEGIQINKDYEINNEESKKEDVKSKISGKNKKSPIMSIIPDDPPEIICPDLKAHFSMSIAMAVMASILKNQNIYEYTKERLAVKYIQSPTIPVISIFCNGKGFPGKCQLIKKCLILPNGFYDKSIQIVSDLRLTYFKLWTAIQTKFPSIIINDYGEMIPPFDRPEQFLDIILEVVKETELENKIKVILEICSTGIFDFNKGKYEVITGQFKNSEEMVTLIKDLTDRYPIVIGVVNPLRKSDVEPWNNLTKMISDHCWIIGKYPQVVPRAQKLAENVQLIEESPIKMSIIGLNVDGYSIYEDYISCFKHCSEAGRKMCVWLEDLCGETWLMDMICGLQSYFVVIPSIRCFSGASKIDRWMELTQDVTSICELQFPDLFQSTIEETEENI